jgi:ankyrin repeat protein
LNACRENNTEEAITYLTGKHSGVLNFNVEIDNWNPLLWASCNGNMELVDRLMEKQSHNQYIKSKDTDVIEIGNPDDLEDNDPFHKPKDARKVGKYTPLHWASYKGHYNLVCKFLKREMDPLDIDMYGNTAVH